MANEDVLERAGRFVNDELGAKFRTEVCSLVESLIAALREAREELAQLKARRFPLQRTRKVPSPKYDQRASVPWIVGQMAWDRYAGRYGKEQSVYLIAERGGFGNAEMDDMLPGWREIADKIDAAMKPPGGENWHGTERAWHLREVHCEAHRRIA